MRCGSFGIRIDAFISTPSFPLWLRCSLRSWELQFSRSAFPSAAILRGMIMSFRNWRGEKWRRRQIKSGSFHKSEGFLSRKTFRSRRHSIQTSLRLILSSVPSPREKGTVKKLVVCKDIINN